MTGALYNKLSIAFNHGDEVTKKQGEKAHQHSLI